MNANELRIGNYVSYQFSESRRDVEICFNDFKILSIAGGKDYEPIPLTEQWFIYFGFRKENVDLIEAKKTISFFSLNEFGLFYNSEDNTAGLNFIDDFQTIINSVHQLQNLYFELTNKELTKI